MLKLFNQNIVNINSGEKIQRRHFVEFLNKFANSYAHWNSAHCSGFQTIGSGPKTLQPRQEFPFGKINFKFRAGDDLIG